MNSEHPLNYDESARTLIEAFRRVNAKQSPKDAKTCAMADMVMAYALNEAEPGEGNEIKKHLITCRACADLYFDVRMTEKWSEASPQRRVPMSETLQATIHKPSVSDSISIFQKILSVTNRHIAFFMAPKGWATATVGLMMVCLALYYSLGVHGPLKANIAMRAKPMTLRSASAPEASYPIRAGDSLMTGERFQVTINTNKDVYGYVILASSSGRIKTLFRGEFKADSALVVPDIEKWEKLDYHTGTEYIYLIAAQYPIEDFDTKIESLKIGDADQIKALLGDVGIYHLRFEHE